jgi:hypothetical protein
LTFGSIQKKTNVIAKSQFFVFKRERRVYNMSNNSKQWTKVKLERYLKEGRGQGIGKDYKPWINTYEFSSKGRATRIYGIKTGRIHQLHSDNQYRAFLIFEFNPRVIDIRESYPLLDVLEVIDDQDDLRFDKFADKVTKEPYVLTTNFLITIKEIDGNEKYIARTVKNSSELRRKITFEKLEIERRYWQQKGIDWKVITEKQLDRQLVKNIEWVRETLLEGDDGGLDKDQLSSILIKYLLDNSTLSLRKVLNLYEKNECLPKGTGLFLFRYLIANREVKVDMTKPIKLSSKIEELLL